MTQEVIGLKLSSGEEIIARVVERNEDTIVLDRPNMVGLVPTKEGVSIQLMPWLASNQDGKPIVSLAHVVAEVTPDVQLEKGYLSKTSGILV